MATLYTEGTKAGGIVSKKRKKMRRAEREGALEHDANLLPGIIFEGMIAGPVARSKGVMVPGRPPI
tara:strand:+ start:163 stop:360 length:198 start_codon:yes stop_codon:yes gene_type:complete